MRVDFDGNTTRIIRGTQLQDKSDRYYFKEALNELEKRPKIGIITGWGEKLKHLEEEGLKVDFIINKPFNFSALSKHINNVFN